MLFSDRFRMTSLCAGISVVLCAGYASADARMKFDYKAAPSAGVVAKLGGADVTVEELESENPGAFAKLRNEEYELRMNALKNLAVKRLVGAEAKEAKLSLEDYIKQKVVGTKGSVTDAQISAFAKEKGIPTEKLTPELAGRVKDFLMAQTAQESIEGHLAALTAKNPIQVYFSKPKGVEIDLAKSPTWGDASAPATLVVFSDFQCPYCSQGAKNMGEIKKKYGDKVRLEFKHFPLPMHPQAKVASVAAACVADQGNEKFWKYHDVLFANQQKLGEADLLAFATQVGADEAKFKECLASKRHEANIEADLAYGQKIGIESTPTFYLNGQLVMGAQPVEAFSAMIDEVLAEKAAG